MPRSNRSVPTDSPIIRYGGVRSGVAAVVQDGVRGGVDGKVPVGVRIPGGNVVKFRGNDAVGVKILAGVAAVVQDGVLARTAAVVQDGVRGGVDGKVPVGVRIKIVAEV